MAALVYQLFSSSALFSQGLFHLICATKNQLKSPRDYSAKPFHPIGARFRRLQLYIAILCLFAALVYQLTIASYSDPLAGHATVHRFNSLQNAAVVFSFLVLAITLLLSDATSFLPLSADLFFGVASALFFLQYSSSSSSVTQISDLQSALDSISGRIAALSSSMCLVLAFQPRLFIADAALGISFCLQGFWALQTGLTLYVDAFVPAGCHRLLGVVSGVEGSTKCELDDFKLRAGALLDLLFVLYVLFALLIFFIVYYVVAKFVGVRSRFGSYESLPNTLDSSHIQLKTITGTQA